jgi:hypothetical protein
MLQDFIEWLREQIAERGLGKVLLSVIGILGAAGSAGTLFDSLPSRAAALVVVLLAAGALVIFLITRRGLLHSELATKSNLLREYCQVIQDESGVKLEFSRWDQTIEINPRGDALVTRRVSVTFAGGGLHFLAHNLRYYGVSPLTPRLRQQVKATAREISVDGMAGARFTTTSSWRSDSEHQILVHFGRPIASGNEVSVEIQWTWPRYSVDLMQGGVEIFDVTFDHPARNAIHKVILLKRRPTDRFVASQIGRLAHFECQPSEDACHVTAAIDRPSPGERFGVRIDKGPVKK